MAMEKKSWQKRAAILGIVGLVSGGIAFLDSGVSVFEFVMESFKYNLGGEWTFSFEVEDSSYQAFKGMKIGYRIFLNQSSSKLSGKGEKWSVNGQDIPFSQHDPIQLEGILEGSKIQISYSLKGKNRETAGVINLDVLEGGKTLIGRFSGTAATSSGSVFANKTSP